MTWTAEDETNPCYCTQCHQRIPCEMAARQGMCDACLASNAETKAEEVIDTHLGVCPKCGSRDLEESPVTETFVESVETLFDRHAPSEIVTSASGERPIGNAEWSPPAGGNASTEVEMTCRDCWHHWRP